MSRKYSCSACGSEIAKEDQRKRIKEPLTAADGCTIKRREGHAARIRCKCGKLTIIMKGSAG